jgi:hypothetical protein
MNERFWRTLLWDVTDSHLENILAWIAAVCLLLAFLLILRVV